MKITWIKKEIEEAESKNDNTNLRESLKALLPSELVDLISHLNHQDRVVVFTALKPAVAVSTFEYLPFSIQKEFLQELPSDSAAQILNSLAPDDRTAFLESLPSNVLKDLMKLLTPTERALTLKLLGYPEESVGRLMTPDYIAVKKEWTVKEVLEHIRHFGQYSETIEMIYVVDDAGHLIDDVPLREFLFADPEKKIAELCDQKFVSLLANEPQKKAVTVFRNNSRSALPVTDSNGILLGIVTMDDILHVVKEEDTREIQQFGGMEALDAPYMETPFFDMMRKRGGWLIILFLGEMLTTTAMTFFEDAIDRAVVLALFLPLIISSGGNSGSQASTLIVRALALGEVKLRDWWRIMGRELISGLFLGGLLGAIGFLRISLWSAFSNVYGEHWILVGITIWLSLIGVVLWGTISGAMMPIILKKFKLDPAVSSAPFVATLVDVTGVIIYFSIALVVLHGTLL